jgi:ATP-dependent Clp protease ATP-binding subunit ClpA
MMFERFTDSARAAVIAAQTHARAFGHTRIGAEHVLLGALDDEQGIPAEVLGALGVDRAAVAAQVQSFGLSDAEALRTIGVDLDQVRRKVEDTFGPGALSRPRRQRQGLFGHRSTTGGQLAFSAEAKKSLVESLREAVAHADHYIGTEQLLLGLLATEEGTVMALLRRLGVTVDRSVIKAKVLAQLQRSA